MKFPSLILVIVLICFCSLIHGNEEEDTEVFVATKEWKPIKKDQPIPRGLHVRINLEAGTREAKLLDDDDKSSSKATALSATATDNEDPPESVRKKVKIVQTPQHVDGVHILEAEDGEQTVFANGKLTSQQIQDALQNMKFEDVEVASDEDIARVAEKFRSLPELKEDLADLNLGMRSESEEVKELMQHFLQAETSIEEKLTVLTDLEYLTHHVDAAQDFVSNNGIQSIIIPSLNSTDSSLQSASAKLLGAAAQGNPVVQLAALKDGIISQILRLIAVKGCDSINKLDNRCKTAVYAISCLIRGFPAGQINFINEGGLSVFSKIFDKSTMDIKVKISTLFHDLVLESNDPNPQAEEQYKSIALSNTLAENGWCDKIISLLFSPNIDRRIDETTSQWSARTDHDVIEKVISAMIVMSQNCKNNFLEASPLVQELVSSYKELVQREQVTLIPEEFYMKMLHLSYKLARLIEGRDEL